MRKLLTAFVSGVALLGLAACDGGDNTTTQGIDQGSAPAEQPADGAGATDDTTQGMDPGTGTDTGTTAQ